MAFDSKPSFVISAYDEPHMCSSRSKAATIQLRKTTARKTKRHAVDHTLNRRSSDAILAELKHRLSEIYDLNAAKSVLMTRPPMCRRGAPKRGVGRRRC
jgi:hypothetical protein